MPAFKGAACPRPPQLLLATGRPGGKLAWLCFPRGQQVNRLDFVFMGPFCAGVAPTWAAVLDCLPRVV